MTHSIKTFALILWFIFSQFAASSSIATNEDLFPLAIIHINDVHARFEETSLQSTKCHSGETCIGGYARTVTVVKNLKEKHKDENPLFLNAGDSFQGSLWYNIHRWNVTSHFLNLLQADVMTIGNHEFEHGVAGVVPFLHDIKSPMVVANIDSSNEPTFAGNYQHSLVLEKGGRKIGVIGVVLHTYDTLAETGNLKFLDEVETVKAEAQKLHDDGVQIIIVLSHSGIEMDHKIAREAGPYIDVIIGGHSHTFLYSGTPLPGNDFPADTYPVVEEQIGTGRKVYIVQASAYTKYVGDLLVWFDDAGEVVKTEGNPIYLSKEVVPDAGILEELKPWKNSIDEVGNRVHGVSKVNLENKFCNQRECSVGNLLTDSYVDHFIKKAGDDEWTYAAIAMQIGGFIGGSLPLGDITYYDLFDVLAFNNPLIAFDIRGDKLLQTLEHSVSSNGATQRNFLQVSGLKVVFNFENPIGERVESIKTLCNKCSVPIYEPLDVFKYYRVIAPSYLANGGSGFTWLMDFGHNRTTGGIDLDVFQAYIEKQSPIFASVEDRIKILL